MHTNNILVAFLSENLQRFFTKSPKFFKIWQLILAVLVAFTGLPQLLEDLSKALHFTIPESLCYFENKTVAWASSAAFVMSLLTTQSKPVAVDEKGNLLKKTNEEALPFTSKMEMKYAIKNNGITPVKTDTNPSNML